MIKKKKRYSKIISIGVYRPENIIDNYNISNILDLPSDWIRKRTGIVTRRRAPKAVSVADMAQLAAERALRCANVNPGSIDMIIVATVTYPYQTPSLSSYLIKKLNLKSVVAYDISAACAGYCYAIAQADAFIKSGIADFILVIGAEKLSDFIDPKDKSISFLLGDGAGAAVVGLSQFQNISPTVWGSDGSGWNDIGMNKSILKDYEKNISIDHKFLLQPTLKQNGPKVFRWAICEMKKIAEKTIQKANLNKRDLRAFIPHQANLRIINTLAKKINFHKSIFIARDIIHSGNTSSASIPLATHSLLKKNPELSGKLALQIGFGAGLVFGAQIIKLPYFF